MTISSKICHIQGIYVRNHAYFRGYALYDYHVACLLIMFLQWRLAMPSLEHENVRHATLLFRAEGVNVQTKQAWRKGLKDEKVVDHGACRNRRRWMRHW